jgi:hypothetical protein
MIPSAAECQVGHTASIIIQWHCFAVLVSDADPPCPVQLCNSKLRQRARHLARSVNHPNESCTEDMLPSRYDAIAECHVSPKYPSFAQKPISSTLDSTSVEKVSLMPAAPHAASRGYSIRFALFEWETLLSWWSAHSTLGTVLHLPPHVPSQWSTDAKPLTYLALSMLGYRNTPNTLPAACSDSPTTFRNATNAVSSPLNYEVAANVSIFTPACPSERVQ